MPSSHKLEGYLCVSAYLLKHVIFFPCYVKYVYDGGGVYPIQLQNVKDKLFSFPRGAKECMRQRSALQDAPRP